MQSNYSRGSALRRVRTAPARIVCRVDHSLCRAGRASITRCARLALGLLLFSCPLPAISADTDRIGLREVLERAMSENKELAAVRHSLDEATSRVRQAALPPNPEIDVQLENFAGDGIYEGSDNADLTISLGWVIEPGLRGGRVDVARARSEQTALDARILRLDVAAETAQRFLTALQSQAHLITAEEAVTLGERLVAAVERRVEVGQATSAELSRARAELASEQLAREDVSHERTVAYHKLAAQWGEASPAFVHVEGRLLDLPEVRPFEALLARIDRNPELARLASSERVAEARLRLARARRWPRLTPNMGARHLGTSNDWALVAGMKLELPVFDRNQGGLAAAHATLARTRAETEAQRLRKQTALREIYEELKHSLHRAEILRAEVIPRFEESLAETRRAYERGRYPYHELRTVQAELLAVRHALIEASTSAHRLVITLERLTGERLVR
jgi:cobalt-zinc-cadmium efflux system outer membrane protein